MPDLAELEQKLRIHIKKPGTISRFADLLFPGVSGYHDVKLGLMCSMANQWDLPNERERIHVLLFGKPGTGKTALIYPLEKDWDAAYISMDPSAASLKGDSRKEDHGSKIFNAKDGGIVAIDDIELMKGMNVLRDVMERGSYSIAKNGIHVEYSAQCRLIAATNDLHRMPLPIINRFDLVYRFNYPTLSQSMDIVRQILYTDSNGIDYLPMLQHYIYLVQTYQPKTIKKKEIESLFKKYFKKHGIPTEDGEEGGKEGRWINTVARLSKALARLHLTDVGPAEIGMALKMKHSSDDILKTTLGD